MCPFCPFFLRRDVKTFCVQFCHMLDFCCCLFVEFENKVGNNIYSYILHTKDFTKHTHTHTQKKNKGKKERKQRKKKKNKTFALCDFFVLVCFLLFWVCLGFGLLLVVVVVVVFIYVIFKKRDKRGQ